MKKCITLLTLALVGFFAVLTTEVRATTILMDFNGDSGSANPPGGPAGSVADFQEYIAENISGAAVSQFNLGDNPAGLSFNSNSGPAANITLTDDPNAADAWDPDNDMQTDGFFFRGSSDSTTITLNFDPISEAAFHKLYLFTGRTTDNVASGHATQFVFDGQTVNAGALDSQVTEFTFHSFVGQTSLSFDWNDPGNPNADPDRILSGAAIVAATVPEPSTLGLILLGMMTLCLRRRR